MENKMVKLHVVKKAKCKEELIDTAVDVCIEHNYVPIDFLCD